MLLDVGAGRHAICSPVSPSHVAISRRWVCARQSAMNCTVFIKYSLLVSNSLQWPQASSQTPAMQPLTQIPARCKEPNKGTRSIVVKSFQEVPARQH